MKLQFVILLILFYNLTVNAEQEQNAISEERKVRFNEEINGLPSDIGSYKYETLYMLFDGKDYDELASIQGETCKGQHQFDIYDYESGHRIDVGVIAKSCVMTKLEGKYMLLCLMVKVGINWSERVKFLVIVGATLVTEGSIITLDDVSKVGIGVFELNLPEDIIIGTDTSSKVGPGLKASVNVYHDELYNHDPLCFIACFSVRIANIEYIFGCIRYDWKGNISSIIPPEENDIIYIDTSENNSSQVSDYSLNITNILKFHIKETLQTMESEYLTTLKEVVKKFNETFKRLLFLNAKAYLVASDAILKRTKERVHQRITCQPLEHEKCKCGDPSCDDNPCEEDITKITSNMKILHYITLSRAEIVNNMFETLFNIEFKH